MTQLKIIVTGLDKLAKAFNRFPKEITRNMSEAGHEAGKEIVETQGLQSYPPETEANKPPTPYYQRGFGMIYKNSTKGTSENYGKQFYIKRVGDTTTIGNRASYAKYLTGKDDQAIAMGKKGWRILIEVAKEKLDKIKRIYQAWIDKTIKDLGL